MSFQVRLGSRVYRFLALKRGMPRLEEGCRLQGSMLNAQKISILPCLQLEEFNIERLRAFALLAPRASDLYRKDMSKLACGGTAPYREFCSLA